MLCALTAATLLSCINLGALQAAAVVDINRLPFGELIEGHRAGLAMTVAGILYAAEGKLDLGADGWGVDVDDARLHLFHGVEGLAQVVGIDRHRESVLRRVGHL